MATRTSRAKSYQSVALVLQGGGALGAYQAGAYCRLIGTGHVPDWVAGVSIGGINAAIIAGNPADDRPVKLRAFWEKVTPEIPFAARGLNDHSDRAFNQISAMSSVVAGVPGFFEPRLPPAWLQRPGTIPALSFYDTRPLRRTLTDLIDFDRLNDGGCRLSLGAVDVATGNSIYFDTAKQTITVDHVLASGALPPGFPPIEIDGRHYWDGGIVSNTPLQYVLDEHREQTQLVLQVDLFSARGPVPATMLDVIERRKDIVFSSRTRLNTDAYGEIQKLRRSVHRLLDKLPDHLADDPDAQAARALATRGDMTIVHLIYRTREHELASKDYEFSRASMEEHWHAGEADADRALAHPEWHTPPADGTGVRVFDFGRRHHPGGELVVPDHHDRTPKRKQGRAS
jgi:NTE family protein